LRDSNAAMLPGMLDWSWLTGPNSESIIAMVGFDRAESCGRIDGLEISVR
jgi:hypothetical protein